MHRLSFVSWQGLRRSVAGVVLSIALEACVSPTIPLPPPELPTVSASAASGYIHLKGAKGGARADAIIVVYNRNPSVPRDKRVGGAQANAEGAWECDILASNGDVLDISQDVLGERSDSVVVEVKVP
ncbi:MAG: hypothetical protein U0174_18380 [Polyangiaceae bacterium]